MDIEVAGSQPVDIYRLLISCVTPRPIAWVTSIDAEGRVNLAPFSFFNAFGADPPVVVFAPNRKRDGSKKDTLNNVETTGEFVINAAVADLADEVNLSSKDLPHGESEVELTGLSLTPSRKGETAPTGRIAGAHGVRAAASAADRRPPVVCQPRDRRGGDVSRRRQPAR